MVVEDLHTRQDWGVLSLERTHCLFPRPHRVTVEGFHLLIPLVLLPCDMFDMSGYWFLVSVELALVG